MLRKLFLLYRAWAADRFRHWLVSWVFLAGELVDVLSFTLLDLTYWAERAYDWLERQQYHDSGRGPFKTYELAVHFAQTEVGVPYRVLFIRGAWRVYVRCGERRIIKWSTNASPSSPFENR